MHRVRHVFLMVFIVAPARAAAPGPRPLTLPDATRLAAADAKALDADDAVYARYLWDGGIAPKDRPALRAIVQLISNNVLSRSRSIVRTHQVTPGLWRLDLYALRALANVYERLAAFDAYAHTRVKLGKEILVRQQWPGGLDGKRYFKRGVYRVKRRAGTLLDVASPNLPTTELLYLRERLVTEVPILNARHVISTIGREIHYGTNKATNAGFYAFQGIKDRDDVFRIAGLDLRTVKRRRSEIGAIPIRSGVKLGRLIGGFESAGGYTFGTFDPADATGRGNPKRNPLGHRHDAEEWIFPLSNDLPGFALTDAKGVLQLAAPADKLGLGAAQGNLLHAGNDPRIHNFDQCFKCHLGTNSTLRPFDEWARKTYRKGGPGKFVSGDRKAGRDFAEKFLSDLESHFGRQNRKYAHAIRQATVTPESPKGMTVKEAATAYAKIVNGYIESELTAADAARELGCSTAHWIKMLKLASEKVGGNDPIFGAHLDDDTIDRVSWEEGYGIAWLISQGTIPIEVLRKRRRLVVK